MISSHGWSHWIGNEYITGVEGKRGLEVVVVVVFLGSTHYLLGTVITPLV